MDKTNGKNSWKNCISSWKGKCLRFTDLLCLVSEVPEIIVGRRRGVLGEATSTGLGLFPKHLFIPGIVDKALG